MAFVDVNTGKKISLSKGYESRTIPYDEWRRQQEEKRAAGGTDSHGTASPRLGMTGGDTSGEAWTRAAPAQTRVPAPKAASADGIWARGSRYSGIGSNPAAVPSQPASYQAGKDDYRDAWAQGLTGTERRERKEDVHRQLAELAGQAQQAQVDLDTDALNSINRRRKELRASIGEQTFGDRVNDTLSGAVQGIAHPLVNIAGTAVDILGAINTRNRNYTTSGEAQAAQDNIARYRGQLKTAGTAEERERLERLIRSNENRLRLITEQTEAQEARTHETAEKFYQIADRIQDDSTESIASAKEGAGALGQLAVDVGVAGTQMGMDALTAALTGGSALVPMAVRSFGGGAQEARRSGADLDRQLLYGVGSAALSVGTEKISNIAKPFQKMFGRGAAETIAGSLVNRFGENEAIQLMQRLSQTAAGRIALSAIGEGGEEVVEAVLQPFLKRATFDPNARFDAGEAKNDFLVGAILGGLGGVPEGISQIGSRRGGNRTETGAGADVRVPAGVDVPRAETGAQGVLEGPGTVRGHAPETAPFQTAPAQRDVIMEAAKRGGRLEAETVQSSADVMEQDAQRLYGKEKTASPKGEAEREYHGQIIDTIRANLDKVQGMPSVARLTGSEFQKTAGDTRNLRQKVIDFFNSIGNKVHRPDMGEIELNAAGARSSVAHGYGRLKAATFAALPSVLEQGQIIDVKPPYAGHEYESYLISAPVDVNGTTCYVGALVIKDPNVQRYKLHEVLTTDENGVPLFKSETGENSDRRLRSDTPLDGEARTNPTSLAAERGAGAQAPLSEVEGTRPLNSDSTITQPSDSVKARGTDPLMEAIFSTQKRVDQAALTPEQFSRLADLNEQGTVGMDAAGRVYQVDPAEHIDRRSMDGVGGKGLNAFSFDHPELHGYFKRAAEALIADADLSMQFPAVRRYERGARGRQVRQGAEVSAHLRQAMDETGLSRAQLIDAAKRIVEDHGQENAAAAKRVEIILDSMLENGWTAMTGKSVPPNQAYIDAKSRIAGSRAGEARESYIPPELDADDGLGAADAGSLSSAFERMQAQTDTFHPINEDSARRIMEEQSRAPSEVPATNPETGRNITKTVSTILNSPLTSPEMAAEIENAVAAGGFDYIPVTDRAAVQRAQSDIADRGLNRVADEFLTRVDLGQRIRKNDITAAMECYNQALAAGDRKTAFDLAAVYQGDMASAAAQSNSQLASALYSEYARQIQAAEAARRAALAQSNWERQFAYQQQDAMNWQFQQAQWDCNTQAAARDNAYSLASTMLKNGILPDSASLASAGISQSDAAAYVQAAQQAAIQGTRKSTRARTSAQSTSAGESGGGGKPVPLQRSFQTGGAVKRDAASKAERTARTQEAYARRGVSAPNTAALSAAGGTGEARTRAVPSQTRVPAPKK